MGEASGGGFTTMSMDGAISLSMSSRAQLTRRRQRPAKVVRGEVRRCAAGFARPSSRRCATARRSAPWPSAGRSHGTTSSKSRVGDPGLANSTGSSRTPRSGRCNGSIRGRDDTSTSACGHGSPGARGSARRPSRRAGGDAGARHDHPPARNDTSALRTPGKAEHALACVVPKRPRRPPSMSR